jgi:hypothetical protein
MWQGDADFHRRRALEGHLMPLGDGKKYIKSWDLPPVWFMVFMGENPVATNTSYHRKLTRSQEKTSNSNPFFEVRWWFSGGYWNLSSHQVWWVLLGHRPIITSTLSWEHGAVPHESDQAQFIQLASQGILLVTYVQGHWQRPAPWKPTLNGWWWLPNHIYPPPSLVLLIYHPPYPKGLADLYGFLLSICCSRRGWSIIPLAHQIVSACFRRGLWSNHWRAMTRIDILAILGEPSVRQKHTVYKGPKLLGDSWCLVAKDPSHLMHWPLCQTFAFSMALDFWPKVSCNVWDPHFPTSKSLQMSIWLPLATEHKWLLPMPRQT